MSKLEDNERWKSKMLLTEHAEQYESQSMPEAARLITSEERTMVRDFILLPHIDTMVAKSIEEIERSSNVLKRAYLMAGQTIQRQIMQDIYNLKRELNQRNIKVIPAEQEDFLLYFEITCRGYHERFGLTRDVMRSEISLRLTRYMTELEKALTNSVKISN